MNHKNKFQRVLLFTGAVGLLLFAGCSKKSNPLFGNLPAGINTLTLSIPQIDTTGTEINRIFVLVEGDGTPIPTGFQLGDFSMLEGGEPGIPFEVGPVTDRLYLVIAIDRSGSMAGSRTTAANAAAVTLVNALSSNDFMAIVEFESVVVTTLNFTNDKATVINTINAGGPLGGTSMYDAVVQGAGLLQGVAGRRLLIVLADGDDNSSSATLGSSIDSANDKGISVYTVALGSGLDTAALQQIASETSGTFAASTTGTDLGAIFLDVLDRFNNLTYIRYRRHKEGSIEVFSNFQGFSARASKRFD